MYTIGHGTRSVEELVRVLRAHDIRGVVDIRRFPGSRRSPHLARVPLAAALDRAGIGYEWWEELGGRRSPRGDSRHRALRDRAFQAYADYMDTAEFRDAIARLIDRSRTERFAVMCAETLWWRCHRRLVADALTLRGVDVVHVLDAQTAQHHRVTPGLRADDDGWPVYDVKESG